MTTIESAHSNKNAESGTWALEAVPADFTVNRSSSSYIWWAVALRILLAVHTNNRFILNYFVEVEYLHGCF